MIKLAICGAAGRMGSTIAGVALRDKDVVLTAMVERPGHALIGKKLHDLPVTDNIRDAFKNADVAIDFTSPESTIENAKAAQEAKKAMVVGTTGLTGALRDMFLQVLRGVPVVFSPNMSLSANVLFDMVENLSRLLPGYDAEVTEIHHNQKKDAPSGTAQRLAESVQRGRHKGQFVYGRHGLTQERKTDDIGVHALRGGDVVGEHTVYFFGHGERVALNHLITSREAFASGAVVAAKWLVGKPAGLYDMRDVLGLKKG